MRAFSRVFGANTVEPDPATLLEFLTGLIPDAQGHFQGDDQGWFRLRLVSEPAAMHVERYLATEEGIRAELNTWAAWVEATGEGPEHAALMQRLIATQQLVVLHDFPAELAEKLCAHLARRIDGIYQVDGRGFFTAEGAVLLSED